jgi:hypothetical protein
MFRRTLASAALVSCVLMLSGDALAQQPLFPVLDCWEEVSETEVRLHIGVTNLDDQETTNPVLNSFNIGGNSIPAPTVFKPGYVARTFSITVSKTEDFVSWILGQPDYPFLVVPGSMSSEERCSNEAGVAGPIGPEGPTGPTGPAGPAGESAGQLLTQCELVTASIPEGKEFGTELLIACGPDETLMQGGGVCGKGNLRGSYQVDTTTWKVVCRSPKGIQGSALCCPQD